MKIILIEDETLAADKLERMILRLNSEHEILQKIRSVEGAIEWFTEHDMPDLLMLDIHLLDGSSFDILKEVTITCPVIFTTAFDHYALDAFQLHSVDYLLKPISLTKLEQAFQKLEQLQQNFERKKQNQHLEQVIQTIETQQQTYKSRFLVKSGSRLFPVAIEQINYFFSADRITFLVLKDEKKYSISYTLDDLESLLNPSDFFRINRKMIVHIDSIQMVHKHFKDRLKIDLLPTPKEEIFVSSRRVTGFQEWLDR